MVLAPVGLAGTPTTPEINDPTGDAGGKAYLDVTRAWVTQDASTIYFNVKLANLGSGNPADTGDARYQFRVDFTDAHGAHYVEARVSYEDTSGVGRGQNFCGQICVGVGTDSASDNTSPGSAKVDAAAGVVTVGFARSVGSSYTLDHGAVLTGIHVTTGSVGLSGAVTNAYAGLGPAYNTADTTGTATYVVI